MGLLGNIFKKSNTSHNATPFDPYSENAIYDIIMAMSFLTTETCDSSMYVFLTEKRAIVIVDEDYVRNKRIHLNDPSSFNSLGFPHDIARILSTTPFTINGNILEFISSNMSSNRLDKQRVVNAIRNGVNRSKFATVNTIQIIDSARESIELRVR